MPSILLGRMLGLIYLVLAFFAGRGTRAHLTRQELEAILDIGISVDP